MLRKRQRERQRQRQRQTDRQTDRQRETERQREREETETERDRERVNLKLFVKFSAFSLYLKYSDDSILIIPQLKLHSCRFENLPICSNSYKNNILKVFHS